MIVVLSCSCLWPIHWSQVLSWEWRCSWSSADRRCSNYIWVINNFIANSGESYIRSLTVYTIVFLNNWNLGYKVLPWGGVEPLTFGLVLNVTLPLNYQQPDPFSINSWQLTSAISIVNFNSLTTWTKLHKVHIMDFRYISVKYNIILNTRQKGWKLKLCSDYEFEKDTHA